MSSMHSVNQRENKKAPALIGSGTSVLELDTATSRHIPLGIKLQQLSRLIAHDRHSLRAP